MESFIWEKNSFQSLKRNSPSCFFKFTSRSQIYSNALRDKKKTSKNPIIFKSLCLIIFFIRTKNLILFAFISFGAI